MSKSASKNSQPLLFISYSEDSFKKTQKMSVFSESEVMTSVRYLPVADKFSDYVKYREHLINNLPYNSLETRQRRANYILERFYPDGTLDTPLTFFTSQKANKRELYDVVFFHLCKAEPILQKVADELIFPALPIGKISRDQVREFIYKYMPHIRKTSELKVLNSIFKSYNLLGVGKVEEDVIKFQVHQGLLSGFVYVFLAEFPNPGIFSFDRVYNGPAHHWLLWDKEWMRKQLYTLRDMGVISKVSEIDNVRQFSLEYGQQECLVRYFNALGH